MAKPLFFRLVFFLLFPTCLLAQKPYPQNYFSSPLDIPLAVSGNFAELRANHFHSGIDFRTSGRIGASVYAAAAGYVSRIKVSSAGGGKILYITHPNGFKSVYMHLDSFTGVIADYVRDYQYDNKVFEFDIDIAEAQLPVTKQMLIAKSGNTGSSGGPHLHFELRQADNDMPINPLLFGYQLCDQTPPTIDAIRIYPADDTSAVGGKNEAFTYILKSLQTKKVKNKKAAAKKQSDTIPVWGKCYFGIDAFDQLCNSVGKKGVYQLNLFVDQKLAYSHCINNFLFEDTRYINELIDYELFLETNKRYMLTRIPDFTPISMYENVKNRGVFSFTDNETHEVTYEASDYAGNIFKTTFWVQSVEPEIKTASKNVAIVANKPAFLYSKENTFFRFDFFVELEKNTLYESIDFDYQVFKCFGKHDPVCYRILKESIPIHKPFRLGLSAQTIPQNLRSHSFITRVQPNGRLSYERSTWEKDFLIANPRAFGTFSIAFDTVMPQIKPLNFKDSTTLKNTLTELKIKITDDFSGIKTYNCYLNDAWILAEYDAKNQLLTIDIGTEFSKGNNTLKIILTDCAGNERVENFTFKYEAV